MKQCLWELYPNYMSGMKMGEVGSIGQKFILLMRAIGKYTLEKHKVYIILEPFNNIYVLVQNKQECPKEQCLYQKAEYQSSHQKI